MVTKDELRVKLIDFGSCKDMEGTEFERKFEEERKKQNSLRPSYKNFVGTPNYMAPECVRNKNSDFASDCWSMGCLLYHLFTGFPPFLGKSDYLIFIKSTEAKYKFPDDIVPPLAQDLISKLIVVDPSQRLTIEQIFDHPYLKEDIIKLQYSRYPYFELKEYAYQSILKKTKSLQTNYKLTSEKLDKIKKIEAMQEDCQKNDINTEEKTVQEENKLLEEKETLLQDYNFGLQTLKSEINDLIKKTQDSNLLEKEKLINKFLNMEKQLQHEFYKLDYE